MAQFLTLLSILLLVAVFNPIVCPTSQLYNERQDRAPHIKLSEHSQQYVGDTYGSVEGRLRKTSAYKDNNNPGYRNQEQLPPPPIPPLSNAHNPTDTNVDTSTDSLIDQRIRMVFKTDFEPDVVYVYNDKHESSALAVPGSEEDSVVNESDDDNIKHECLEKDERSLYCTKLRNYPDTNNINQLINEKFPHFKKFFNNGLVSTQNISHRMETPIKEFICNSRSRPVFPEAARDESTDDWIPLIQTSEFQQGFLIEECVETSETCGERIGASIPKKYKAICKQHYIKRALLAVRHATIQKGQFKFPSCCRCEIYQL